MPIYLRVSPPAGTVECLACRAQVDFRSLSDETRAGDGPRIGARLRAALSNAAWLLEIDPDMPDGQCLLFHYPSAFPPVAAGYVRPVVKMELGARSDDWPHETNAIQSYVIECFPSSTPTQFSRFVSSPSNAPFGERRASSTNRHSVSRCGL